MLDFLWFLLSGIIVGLLATQINHGGRYGIAENVVIGIVGSLCGGFLFRLLEIAAFGTFGAIIMAFGGAIAFIASMRILLLQI